MRIQASHNRHLHTIPPSTAPTTVLLQLLIVYLKFLNMFNNISTKKKIITHIHFLMFFPAFIALIGCDQNKKNNPVYKKESVANHDSLAAEHSKILYSKLASIPQEFEINPKIAKKIIGKKGTEILFDSRCINSEDETVFVKLIECYSLKDFILNNLNTITDDDKLLESRGMIYLKVFDQKGKELTMNKGKLTIKSPVQVDSSFKFFEGKYFTNNIVWSENKNVKIGTKDISRKKQKTKYVKGISCGSRAEGYRCDTIYGYHDSEIVNSTTKFFSEFRPETFGWYNLDRYSAQLYTNIDISVESNQQEIFAIFMLPKGYNTIVSCAYKIEFFDGFLKLKQVPNLDSEFLFLRISGSKYYFDIISYKSGEQPTLKVKLQETTFTGLSSILQEKYGQLFTKKKLKSENT